MVDLKRMTQSKYHILFIALFIYLFFLIVSHLFSPWSKQLAEGQEMYGTGIFKHNFLFVRIFLYGISDMLELLFWAHDHIDVIILGAVAFSLKDAIQGKLLKHDVIGLSDNPFSGAANLFISGFLLENVMAYLCTVLVYTYFVNSDYIWGTLFRIMDDGGGMIGSIQSSSIVGFLLTAVLFFAFMLFLCALFFFPALYALPNLLKLCFYTGLLFVYNESFATTEGGVFSYGFPMLVLSCAAVFVINMAVDCVSGLISKNMYTLNGLKEVCLKIWDYICFGSPDLAMKYLILSVVAMGFVLIDYSLIVLILVFLS